jgi:pimeloyl-ACP methyl ester carboxylesterase
VPLVARPDASIHYTEQGAGTCLLFAHSYLCSGLMWAAQTEALSSSYRTVNVDLRGHGESSAAGPGLSLFDLVHDHVAVLDELGIERAVWVGLSIGGMIALRAALRAPERVSALVLADTSAASEPGVRRLRYRAMGAGARLVGLGPFMGQVMALMLGPSTHRDRPDLVAEWRARIVAAHLPSILNLTGALFARESLLDRLGEILVPTLVLVGEEDEAQPPARSRELAAGLPNAELIVVPEAGHLSPLEQPEVVSETIRDFLVEALPERRDR